MKGGPVINLCVQDLPRLSGDIDVVALLQEKPRASPGLDPIDLEGKGSWLTVGKRKSDFFDPAAIEWGAGKLLPAELRGEGGEGHGHLGPLAKTTGLGQTLSDRSPESGPARPARIGGEAGKTTWQR